MPTTIATVLWMTTRFGIEIMQGTIDFARRQEWSVVRLDNSGSFQPATLRRLKVNGIIAQLHPHAPLKALHRLNLPIVDVSNAHPDLPVLRVASDDQRVGELAAEHFLSKGHRNFAFCGEERSGTARLRGRGFVERIKAAGGTVSILNGEFDPGKIYSDFTLLDALTRWLAGLPKPCAVFGWTDGVCDSIVDVCERTRLKIPQEISLLGVNNDFNRLVDDTRCAVSSVVLSGHEIGYRAAQRLALHLEGAAAPASPELIAPLRIVERRSTDFYAVSDAALRSALRFIQLNCHRMVTVEEVARAARVSRRVLEKRFQAELRSSPYEELLRCRVERAKELLLNTQLKLDEIAQLCGYDESSQFSTFFKKRGGCNPQIYRRRLAHTAQA